MAARSKSKKTIKAKTKKTVSASKVKQRSKRSPSVASPSSARARAGKSKSASNTPVARNTAKTIRAKTKTVVTKASNPKRTSPKVKAVGHESVTARKPANAARRKAAASKSISKKTRTAAAAKPASTVRARLKKQEAKLPTEKRNVQESVVTVDKGAAPLAGSKPSLDHNIRIPEPVDLAPPAKPTPPVVKVQKTGLEETSAVKTLKSAGQRQGFRAQ